MLGNIYAITDPHLLPDNKLLSAVSAALEAGIKTIQLRDKDADDAVLITRAQQLVPLCERHNAKLIINDRVDIAIKSQAHGVHLGQGDGDVRMAREQLGQNAVIGVTCHDSLDLALIAQSQGASYVAFGRFFPSATKPLARPASMELLQRAKSRLTIPVVAIGGITRDNMAPLIQYGADCLALCHELFATESVKVRAEQLCALSKTLKEEAVKSL